MNDEEVKRKEKAARRRIEIKNLPTISLEECRAVFHKWLLIKDPYIIDLLLDFYCANRLKKHKAVWMTIVGPSGGGKTEFLNAFTDLDDVYSVSTVTVNTFLSGMPGQGDMSLLPKLSGKILMLKDLTSILSMNKDAKAEIFGQLREIHDGSYTKVFGNGKERFWEGRVSLLAASTQAIDLSQQQMTHLGERFLYYRIVMPDRKTVAFKALDNNEHYEQMSTEIKNAVLGFLKGINFENIDEMPMIITDEQRVELVGLANFATMARSGVIRDMGPKQSIIFVPTPEMPTRILQQINTLLIGAAIKNGGKLTEEDMQMAYKVALDSIPFTNKMVILEMAKADNQKTDEIAIALGYPSDTIGRYLENLSVLGVCERSKEKNTNRWTLKPEFVDIITKFDKIKKLTDEELEERKELAKTEAELNDEMKETEFENFGEKKNIPHLPDPETGEMPF